MQGELVFCEVAFHFVSDSLHMTPACQCDQITMHISICILCCSRKIVYILLRCQSLCFFGRVQALVGSVIFIVRPDGVRVASDNGKKAFLN